MRAAACSEAPPAHPTVVRGRRGATKAAADCVQKDVAIGASGRQRKASASGSHRIRVGGGPRRRRHDQSPPGKGSRIPAQMNMPKKMARSRN